MSGWKSMVDGYEDKGNPKNHIKVDKWHERTSSLDQPWPNRTGREKERKREKEGERKRV